MESINRKRVAGVEPQLEVHYSERLPHHADMDVVSSVLEEQEKVVLAHAPWPLFPYTPDVRFSLLHAGDCLFLKFYVEERTVVAAHADTHSAVYKDACVEFFVSLDEDGYYNFEFNSTGTCLAAFGKGREGREFLPVEAVDHIRRRAVIDRIPEHSAVRWTLTLAIPLSSFVYHNLSSLRGVTCRANFYKCGDDLPDPHFLCWAPVDTPEPDFHQSQYFGTLVFE
jgi:hypothetical protein